MTRRNLFAKIAGAVLGTVAAKALPAKNIIRNLPEAGEWNLSEDYSVSNLYPAKVEETWWYINQNKEWVKFMPVEDFVGVNA